jgi:phage host-nuclease inhibitor protein Gam
MSAKTENSVMELAIVKKVLAFLNIGEDAKIGNFFAKEVKKAEKAIRDLKRNITTLENAYNDKVDDVNEKLTDAKEAVQDAKIAVTLEDVKTNEAANNFSEVYWNRIKVKTYVVKELEKSLETLKENHEKAVATEQEQIDKYQARIDMIKN